MTKSRFAEATNNPDMIVIPANTELRDRVVTGGSRHSAYKSAIKAAEDAIQDLSVEFDDWLKEEIERLILVFDALKVSGWNAKISDEIFTISHDIKGQATTLGYPVITDICDTLCHLLEKTPDVSHISLNVIDLFVSSIHNIVQQCQRGEENKKANHIAQSLRMMAMKILQQEMKRTQAKPV